MMHPCCFALCSHVSALQNSLQENQKPALKEQSAPSVLAEAPSLWFCRGSPYGNLLQRLLEMTLCFHT